ncbi:MAG: transcription antiterminator [Erysipelotrichaceae bacterium]|nr:transcription antiterminator [Erysipelotrichaceae bacterium]
MLSERQFKILSELSEDNRSYLTANFLAEKFQLSVRTIKSELSIIKREIDFFDFVDFISFPSKGYRLEIHDKKQFKSYIDKQMETLYRDVLGTPKDRVNKIIALLFESKQGMDVQHMADRLFVSKSTLANDLKNAKNLLNQYNIEIIHKLNHGLAIKAKETDIRVCINNENIDLFYAYNEFMTIGQISMNLGQIGEILVDTLTKHKYGISDIALQNLIVHIDIIIRRIMIGFFLEEVHDEALSRDFSEEILIANEIFQKCHRAFGIPRIESEINRLAVYLRGKSNYPESSYITNDIDEFVSQSLNAIKDNFGIDLSDNVQLRISLSLHIIPLITRLKYNMQLKNNVLEHVRKSYPLAYDIASFVAYRIQEKYGYKINEDEIAYFAIYFNTSILSIQKNDYTNKIIIISSLKRSETLLLRERIYSWFADSISELKIIDAFETVNVDFSQYKVICTTESNVFRDRDDTILISQFPTDTDHRNIRMILDGFNGKEDILALFKEEMTYIGKTNLKGELLDKLIKYVENADGCNDQLMKEIHKREIMGGTYFGNFIAMPHPMTPVTKKTHIALALLENECNWDKYGSHVRIILLVSIEAENPRAFQLWSYLSEFITNEAFVNSVLQDLTLENFKEQVSKALDHLTYNLHEY